MNAVSRIAVIICAAPFTNTITMRSIQKCVKSYFRVDTIYFVGYIRYMEKTIKYHIELTEEEDGMLYALATAYSKKFGVKVSKAAATKLSIKLAFKKECV